MAGETVSKGPVTSQSNAPHRHSLNITGLRCHNLPKFGWPKRRGSFYLKLSLGGDSRKTVAVAGHDAAAWNENLYFEADSDIFVIGVFTERLMMPDKQIGELKENVHNLLSDSSTQVVSRTLSAPTGTKASDKPQAIIEFSIVALEPSSDMNKLKMEEAVKEERNALATMSSASPLLETTETAENKVTSVVAVVEAIPIPWSSLLDRIAWFTDKMDKVAAVHPYSQMAWAVLSAAEKIIIDQKNRDDSIGGLVKTMNDVYAFVHEAEFLKRIESQKEILALMAQQTTECAYFIRDYAKNKNFWMRTMKNVMSDVDSKIQGFKNKFAELNATFQGRSAVQTEITVLRIMDDVQNLATEVDLNDMPYAEGARFDTEKTCLPGTRKGILREISDWAVSEGADQPRILLLIGRAGTGKSAISHTIARLFDDVQRLGSSFCFDRSHSAKRRPDNMFSTIARDLADLDPTRKQALWKVIQDKRALRTTRSPREQFEKFILKPSVNLAAIGPTVVVIDALDECGDQESRKIILSILSERIAEIPSNFRFLITARPEQDIMIALEQNPHVQCKRMDTIDVDSTSADLFLYVKAQLGDVPALERQWPNGDWCRLMVERSEGLFQWAFTACRFVKGDGKMGLDPSEQLRLLLSSANRNTKLGALDQLYLDVLNRTFNKDDAATMTRWHNVMGQMLTVKQPLSISALRELQCDGECGVDAVALIIEPLGSLLSGTTQEPEPVRPLHTSLRDFLMDPERSGPFCVDTREHQKALAFATLHVMKKGLRFNICEFETSYLRNEDTPDFSSRAKNAISEHLSYASRYWADHLIATPFDAHLSTEVKDFLHVRLLYWLEVLSVMKEVGLGSKALLSVAEWSHDEEIKSFARDAHKFTTAFGSVIAHSVPHIYLSALAFAPVKSQISQRYLPSYPRALKIENGMTHNWPSIQTVLEGHTKGVFSVAFSSDGKRILSGSADFMIRVWDAETGDVILGPLYYHAAVVCCAAFSPDDKRIVSGLGELILVWDADTGDVVLGPLSGHTDLVRFVSFSHDGKRIVSGSFSTIRVWDAYTGKPLLEPLEEQAGVIGSVAISGDGKHIVSGFSDSTIRIWDAHSGRVLREPLRGHDDTVTSVSISKDGKRIVSGSMDSTICVWDIETGDMVLGPLEKHNDSVRSVTFSHDDKYILSASGDKSIWVGDAETGDTVLGPLSGHFGPVESIAISRDGKRIASASSDCTVRVWNAETVDVDQESSAATPSGVHSISLSPDWKSVVASSADGTIQIFDAATLKATSPPLEGHTDIVTSVAFSKSGKAILSSSNDGTIHSWEAETGSIILGPLDDHRKAVNSVAISPDGARFVSGSDDETVLVWDAKTGKVVLGPFKEHTGAVQCVAFSPDGKCIVSGADDSTIWVRDAETGAVVKGPLVSRTKAINCVTFSPDNKQIMSGSSDGTILVRDAESGSIVLGPLKEHTDAVCSIAFSRDGRRFISGSADRTIRMWDAQTGSVLLGPLKWHTDAVRSVAFSLDGTRFASASHDSTIQVWNSLTGEPILGRLDKRSRSVNSVAFSPDGKRLVTGSEDSAIQVWDADTGEIILRSLQEHTDYVLSVEFSPDGQRIVSGSDDTTIRVWDAHTGKVILGPLMGHSGTVYSVAFSTDGERIVSGSSDKTVRVWDAKTGANVFGSLSGHSDEVYAIAISPSGKRIISGSLDESIRVWDADTGSAILGPLEDPLAGVSESSPKFHWNTVCSLAFSPDGTRMASGAGDTEILVWDTTTWCVVLGPLGGHSNSIETLAFTRDGRRLVSGSGDGRIIMWDAKTGKILLGPLEGHTNTVSCVVLSQNDERMISSSLDGTLRMWDVSKDPQAVLDVSAIDFKDTTKMTNGWVQNSASELLFWVPPWNRTGLWWPRNTAIVPVSTVLNFKDFAHGTSWEQCRKVDSEE